MTIYKCNKCGNIVVMLYNSGVVPSCCGSEMEQLVAKTTDAFAEKHVPVIHKDGFDFRVTVGDVLHPMLEAHFIEWIAIETDKGFQVKYLKPGDDPIIHFTVSDDEKILSAYAFCNVHGLWVTEARDVKDSYSRDATCCN